MTLFRNLVDSRLYKMYRVTMGRTISMGSLIMEDFITGEVKDVPKYMEPKMIPMYEYK